MEGARRAETGEGKGRRAIERGKGEEEEARGGERVEWCGACEQERESAHA